MYSICAKYCYIVHFKESFTICQLHLTIGCLDSSSFLCFSKNFWLSMAYPHILYRVAFQLLCSQKRKKKKLIVFLNHLPDEIWSSSCISSWFLAKLQKNCIKRGKGHTKIQPPKKKTTETQKNTGQKREQLSVATEPTDVKYGWLIFYHTFLCKIQRQQNQQSHQVHFILIEFEYGWLMLDHSL